MDRCKITVYLLTTCIALIKIQYVTRIRFCQQDITENIKVKINQSRYKPGVAQRVPGS